MLFQCTRIQIQWMLQWIWLWSLNFETCLCHRFWPHRRPSPCHDPSAMTIPHGDPRRLQSVSDRRKVTFANEGDAHASDDGKPEVGDTEFKEESSNYDSHQLGSPRRSGGEGNAIDADNNHSRQKEQRTTNPDHSKSEEAVAGDLPFTIQDGDYACHSGGGGGIGSHSPDMSCVHETFKQDATANHESNTSRELRVSSLPLLDLPKCPDFPSVDSNTSPSSRKLSLNLPYTNRPAQAKKNLPPTSSSTRKVRRKSFPQRPGQRYHKIPQEDIISPCDISPSGQGQGELNLACATSPTFNTIPAQQYPAAGVSLSVHNAQVHASFYKELKSTQIKPTDTTLSLHQAAHHKSKTPSPLSASTSTSLRVGGSCLDAFIQRHSALDADTSQGNKNKKQNNTLHPDARKPKKKANLNRSISLSARSLDDITALHTARGGHQQDKKRSSKKPGRAVSSEDLASLRIHHRGARHIADPQPSPGSPSRCCLVSVSRVPMAAATSHLTLDSEYQVCSNSLWYINTHKHIIIIMKNKQIILFKKEKKRIDKSINL